MKFLKLLLLVTTFLSAGFGNFKPTVTFMSAEEAFHVSTVQKGDFIESKIVLADKIHVTADTLKFSIIEPKKIALKVILPKAHKSDVGMVYEESILVRIPLKYIYSKVDTDYTLAVEFSGCSDEGICYNPIMEKFKFKANPNANVGFFTKLTEAIAQSNPNAIVELLMGESSFFIVFLFLVLGLLLALTPCIFPMIPILSSIIVSQSAGEKPSAMKGFIISLVYVLSMAITYTTVGVISGLLGADIQAAMQSPWVLTTFSVMFFALAISLFGYYEMQLPSSWQSRINIMSDNAQGSGLMGTVIMGFLSAFIIGPCVAPPLAGAVIFISQTGDAFLGGLALFAMSMGMGLPLLLVGAGAGKFMPRPGGWMTTVSQTFGVVMLALSIFMLGKVVSPFVTMFLWSMLFMGTAFFMGVFNSSTVRSGAKQLFQLLAFVFLIYGASLFVGLLSGGTSVLHPFKAFTSGTHASASVLEHKASGYTVASLTKKIEMSSKPVMIDFRKKSCAACDELEEKTFPDPRVQEELKRFTFITVDLTKNTESDRALVKKFHAFGTPTIIFFDKNNKLMPDKTMSGFQPPKILLSILKSIS